MTRQEHPLFDRPLEFALGAFMAAAGLVIMITTVILGEPDFAPRYLAEHNPFLVAVYSLLASIGGAFIVWGLVLQSNPQKTILGRGTAAVGHFITAAVTSTYATYLVVGDLQSARNTLLMAFLCAIISGSLIRCGMLIRLNLLVSKVISNAAGNGEK